MKPRAQVVVIIAAMACSVGNAVAQPASTAVDEKRAIDYMYCSELSDFLSRFIGKTEGDTKKRQTWARAREAFRLAALDVSNDDFLQAHQREVIEQVGGDLGGKDGARLLQEKIADCAVLYKWIRKETPGAASE